MYIKITNGNPEPYSIGKLRRDNKDTSFPKRIPDNILADYNVFKVIIPSEPIYDDRTQRLSLGDITELADGRFVRPWNIEQLTQEEIDANTSTMSNQLKAQRDTLLAETDWWASVDLTMSEEQTAYRQALRDITTHENWPYLEDSDWPIKP
jgi:hypothetical protein